MPFNNLLIETNVSDPHASKFSFGGKLFALTSDCFAVVDLVSSTEMHIRRFDGTGSSLGSELIIKTTQFTGISSVENIVATSTADGGLAVAWIEGGTVRLQIFDENNTARTSALQISTAVLENIASPIDLEVLQSGSVVVSWLDKTGLGHFVIIEGGQPTFGDTFSGGFGRAITELENGNILVAHTGESGRTTTNGWPIYELSGTIYSPVGNKISTFSLEVPTFIIGDTLMSPQPFSLTALPGGGFAGAWLMSVGYLGNHLQAQVFDPSGVPIGSLIDMKDPSGGSFNTVQITGSAGGGFVLGWSVYDQLSQGKLFAQAFDSNGQPLSNAFELVGATSGYAPSLATLESGHLAVAWPMAPGGGLPLVTNVSIFEGDVSSKTGTSLSDGLMGTSFNDVILGLEGDDHLTGKSGWDLLSGGDGNDILIGGTGSDTLDGGAGLDTAVYSGLFRSYDVHVLGGAGSVAAGAEGGTDVLSNVEFLEFQDGVLVFDADGVAAQVTRLYDTVLQRAPDQVGLDLWVDRIEDLGATLKEVALGFLNSSEFQAKTGQLSNADYVEFLYQHALGRPSDVGGKSYWLGQLDSGAKDRADLLIGFSESAEHRNLTAGIVSQGFFNTDDDYQTVALLYDTFAGRQPDAQGLIFWAESIENGTYTLDQVADGFANSPEFQSLIAGMSNAQLVEFMYQNTLGRHSEPAGLSYWTYELDAGMDHGELLLGFSQSVEHFALLGTSIINGIDVL